MIVHTLSLGRRTPAKVLGVRAASGNGELLVAWDAAIRSDDYTVEYDTSPTFSAASSDISGGPTSILLTGLTNGTVYYVRVRGFNTPTTTDGEWSDTATGVPGNLSASGSNTSVMGNPPNITPTGRVRPTPGVRYGA